MVKFIESELILLKKEIDEMWTLVYNQLDRAGEAVLTLDKELAQQVMVRERRVNAFELKIDSDVEDIIALYNPVAIDLRFVLAMLKINTNLERLGDFAEGIARFVLRCKEPVLDAELLSRLHGVSPVRPGHGRDERLVRAHDHPRRVSHAGGHELHRPLRQGHGLQLRH